jgi:hypothetical protein
MDLWETNQIHTMATLMHMGLVRSIFIHIFLYKNKKFSVFCFRKQKAFSPFSIWANWGADCLTQEHSALFSNSVKIVELPFRWLEGLFLLYHIASGVTEHYCVIFSYSRIFFYLTLQTKSDLWAVRLGHVPLVVSGRSIVNPVNPGYGVCELPAVLAKISYGRHGRP